MKISSNRTFPGDDEYSKVGASHHACKTAGERRLTGRLSNLPPIAFGLAAQFLETRRAEFASLRGRRPQSGTACLTSRRAQIRTKKYYANARSLSIIEDNVFLIST